MAEVLHGNASGDQLNARNDKTQVYGLKGNDTLTSDGKSDVLLIGGSGDDRLIMSGGNGTLSGGAGNDTFDLDYSATQPLSAVIEDLVPSEDKIVVNFAGTSTPQLSSSVSGNDIVLSDGGLLNVTLKGVRDNDYFDGDTDEQAWEVLWLTNAEREKKNLPALTLSDGLTKGAETRVKEITELGQDGALENHRRPDGTLYYTVLDGKYDYPGENLDGGAESPSQVMDDWIGSASHYKNIMDTDFQKLGVGYNYFDIDESNHRWYWTQLFAKGLSSPESVSTAELLTATPETNTVTKYIPLGEGDNTISNSEYGATIQALGGSASIANTGLLVSIAGSNDNDTIDNGGSFVTLNGGKGNDLISLGASTKENVIQYTSGDGSDTVYGFNDTSTLSLASDDYRPETVGSDVVIAVGTGSITLLDATKSFLNIHSPKDKLLIGTADNDTINNLYDTSLTINGGGGDDIINNHNTNVSIDGYDGNDYIYNDASSVSTYGGIGDDTIGNRGADVTIDAGAGNDSILNDKAGVSVSINGGIGSDIIYNYGSEVTIYGILGNDYIYNEGGSVDITGGYGSDTINNYGPEVTINAHWGNDYIYNRDSSLSIDGNFGDDTINNQGANSTLLGSNGNDFIYNAGDSVTIDGGDGNDTIDNFGAEVTIQSGTGNDSIFNKPTGDSVSIDGGAGNDDITNWSSNTTINAGTGNDEIFFAFAAENRLIQYATGDGKDSIWCFDKTDTISISGSEYTPITINSDIVLEVDTGHIWLRDAASLSAVNIQGKNSGKSKLVRLTEGNDTYTNNELGATIQALGGDDSIYNNSDCVTVDGGTGDDSIRNYFSDSVSIATGLGNDTIINNYVSWRVTINGGAGNDRISLLNYSSYNVIEYAEGEGNDTVWGFDELDMLFITSDDYTPQTVGNDLVIAVGTDSITLVDVASLSSVNISKAYNNTIDGVTIQATDTSNPIKNYGSNVSIDGGAGNDTIRNGDNNSLGGTNVTINGDTGTDTLYNRSANVTILGGDGYDDIHNDITGISVSIDGGGGDDEIYNYGSNTTINLGEGDDFIWNSYTADSVSIDGGSGNDTIANRSAHMTILCGDGNDSVKNRPLTGDSSVSIDGGNGDDTIDNYGSNATINTGTGNDSIWNDKIVISVSIDSGVGDDTIDNWGDSITISGGEGNDYIHNDSKGESVSIDGGSDDDTVINSGSDVTISGGDGYDDIHNNSTGDSVSIYGGSGDDIITNLGSFVTIMGGAGNDSVYLSNDSRNVYIQYDLGDGNDTVWNFSTNDTLKISADSSLVSSANSGNDVIYTVGDNTILLKDGRDKPLHIIIGESGTSGGGSGGNGGGQGGGGSSGGSGGQSGGGQSGGGSGTSGGTSSGEGRGSDASGGTSAGGAGSSSGSGGSSGSGSSGNQTSAGISGGGGIAIRSVRRYGNNTTSTTATEARKLYNEMLSTAQQTQQPSATAQHVYTGGNQVISNYQSGDKIIFGAQYTGAFFDGAGNFLAGSSTGALAIENAMDKVIDLSDAAGNDFVKAYAATTAGVIDGRGIAGFELINGSAGGDVIYAGDGGSQLWGGGDNVTDILVGGGGADIFIGGRTQGADVFLNASSADIVHLNDATLSDIVATAEDNGVVAVAFNTGNVIAVQSTEALSSTFMLADGAAYRYNHAAKTWQTA